MDKQQLEGMFGMVCPNCKGNIRVGSTNKLYEREAITYARDIPINDVDNKLMLIITVVTCPNCGYDIVCQIDDVESRNKREEQTKLMAEVMAMRKYQNPTKKYLKLRKEKRKKLNDELTAMRADLVIKWNGKTVCDPNGKAYKLDVYLPEEDTDND